MRSSVSAHVARVAKFEARFSWMSRSLASLLIPSFFKVFQSSIARFYRTVYRLRASYELNIALLIEPCFNV